MSPPNTILSQLQLACQERGMGSHRKGSFLKDIFSPFREALAAPQIHTQRCLLHGLNNFKGGCQVSVNGVDSSKSHPSLPVISDASARENAGKVYLSPRTLDKLHRWLKLDASHLDDCGEVR